MMLKRLRTLTVTFLMFIMSFPVAALEENEVAAYTDFINTLITTSSISKKGEICVLGSDEISSAFLLKNDKVINLDKNPDKFHSCRAIYVAVDSEKFLKSELSKFSSNKIFTVAIFEGFTDIGGMVQVQMGRRNFEMIVNAKAVKDSNVRINSLLTNLIIN